MVSWGLMVNDYGNAILDDQGDFKKVEGEGASETIWREMTEYAREKGIKGGNYKKNQSAFREQTHGPTPGHP